MSDLSKSLWGGILSLLMSQLGFFLLDIPSSNLSLYLESFLIGFVLVYGGLFFHKSIGGFSFTNLTPLHLNPINFKDKHIKKSKEKNESNVK